ncbi:transporter substrate-binding domain-containing protein [Paracoccus saliphilus]|uniref:General L-amino acid transport system substrate-binding protein n=1 Tax=Paracoccus saliphilus TaxID=405559 RepID=A0AA45W2T0_9RHOB|nr:transporter substrate-binding domain-containing protein [Paracoccus saliphilus]WCR05075.1 transporter substrate-binding domain-containing protein [Paracoccus saliphilus]SIS70410.1 general L-amino acid transport system substrate-binding protein [Paracoccus saliphilus]
MKLAKKFMLATTALAGLASAASSEVADDSRLKTVLDRGLLQCSGHNGSFLGFAEVNDEGNWKGIDIDLCRALAAGLFGTAKDNLEIVPISWAQRWPALQSGDIDVVIKASGWTQSRDTDLNLAFSRPYFISTYQTMAHAELGAETLADLGGGTLCVGAGTSTERAAATYLEANNIEAELLTFENGDELRNSYYEGRCDGQVEIAPGLAAGRVDAPNGAENHVILPDVIALEAVGIVVPEGDDDWLDIQNWMLSSLWFAEAEGITSENVDDIRANPPSEVVAKFLGVTPGYGERLGLDDDWAYNMIKEVGSYSEIYDRNIGSGSRYGLERGLNALYKDGGVFYPMIID